MSEAKFTPGPWEYNDPGKFTQGHGKFSETAVYAAGNAFPWRMAEVIGPDDQTEIATARLISAAPDMLAALEGFVAKIDPAILVENDLPTSPLADELRSALAAIAKAEGRQP